MQAMLLAAGLGTRLRPLTEERPKPAVPVGNVPLGRFALEALARAGVTRVVMNSHHLPEGLDRWLIADAPAGMRIERVHEPALLGTGGGIKNAWRHLDPGEPLLVMNSDILFAPDLGELLRAHADAGATATMVLRPDPDAERFGAIEVDAERRVRRLLGAPDHQRPLRALMFTGVSVLSPGAFADLPEEGCIIRNSYRRWVDDGVHVHAVVSEAVWRDLGTLDAYLEANVDLATGALRWPGVQPDPASSNLIHVEAEVASDASLEESVVGRGARVAPGAQLRRVVVWDHAAASGELTDAVVTPHRTVAVRE